MLLSELLESTGFQVAYLKFKKPPSIPYIIYFRDNDTNISSDQKVHGKFRNYTVELYTEIKDPTAESKVEAVLETIDPDYTTDETYIESEELYQVVYSIKIIERR
jgi:hypothetical protein